MAVRRNKATALSSPATDRAGSTAGAVPARLMGASIVMVLLVSCAPSDAPVAHNDLAVSDAPAISARATAAIVAVTHPPAVIERAMLVSTAECMRESGFEFPPLGVFRRRGALSGSLAGIAPVLNVNAAEAHGYGRRISRSSWRTDPDVATRRYLSEFPPDKRRMYQRAKDDPEKGSVSVLLPGGIEVSAPAGGCIARARRDVFGSVGDFLRHFYVPQEIKTHTAAALKKEATRATLERYQVCMAALGYEVESPQQTLEMAMERFGHRRIDDSPTALEREMSVADARCQGESRFTVVLDREILTLATEWLAANERELVELVALQEEAARRSNKIIDGS